MTLILTVLAVFAVLVASELWWRKRQPHDEFSRKFVHITVGSFVAFWPYFLSWNQIIFLSGCFVVVVLISRYFGIFRAIHAVERPTWGEVFFALAVGALALFVREPLIYTIALLHMSLADGIAAVVGTVFGRSNSYKIYGHVKSLAGSLTFLAISLVLLVIYSTVSPTVIPGVVVAGLAVFATGIENIAVLGLDNLLVPVVIAAALTALS